MNRFSKLAAQAAGVAAVATLMATSAFADWRHNDRTEHRSSQANVQRRESAPRQTFDRRGTAPAQVVQRDRQFQSRGQRPAFQPQVSRDRQWRDGNAQRRVDRFEADRSFRRADFDRRDSRTFESRRVETPRFESRGFDRREGDRGFVRGGFEGRRTFDGHVRRFIHERGGFRVWLDRDDFSFWVPEARWNSWPLRVGLGIRFGGYWDPAGYYYVDDIGAYGSPAYTSGVLRGVVESINYARGTIVLHDDISGAFVTTVIASGDRRMASLRPGDWVDLSGSWSRGGLFQAYGVVDFRGAGY
ncbi:MAG TPA: hypothetical protein VEZ11_03335 [Thermoanaerobaculia bacterium]|nr:hypothetical protein [Thermoanaerobaculia bacterium]